MRTTTAAAMMGSLEKLVLLVLAVLLIARSSPPRGLQQVRAAAVPSSAYRGGAASKRAPARGNVVAAFADRVCADNNLESAEETIRRYLNSTSSRQRQDNDDVDVQHEFHIQGWRWHTMSLAREAGRLQKLARKLQQDSELAGIAVVPETDLAALKKATDYVVDFNMKGLHKIEKNLFFPWVRQKVATSLMKGSLAAGGDDEYDVPAAFEVVMDRLDSDRCNIEKLGKSLVSVFLISCVAMPRK